MREPRGPAGMQDESRKPGFRDTLPPATGRRADGRRPRASRTGRKACKKAAGFCTRTASNQKEKSARSPVFPRFPHSREFLCGKKFASLRQEINFFQQRNSIFAAQKRPPRRRNAPYGQSSRLFFNTSGPISVLPPRHTDAGLDGKPCFLTRIHGFWRHSGTGTAGNPPAESLPPLSLPHRRDFPATQRTAGFPDATGKASHARPMPSMPQTRE